MTRDKFIKNLEETYQKGVELVKKKNHDYAKGTDPWANFRFAELVGVSVERAILVRMSDKIARISNVIDKDILVKNESIEDTLIDLINYTAILKAYLDDIKERG